jgi:hypothetical protein
MQVAPGDEQPDVVKTSPRSPSAVLESGLASARSQSLQEQQIFKTSKIIEENSPQNCG